MDLLTMALITKYAGQSTYRETLNDWQQHVHYIGHKIMFKKTKNDNDHV